MKITYSEISYPPENPIPNYPTKFANLHSIDFSIFFHTDSNDLIEIFWDDQFYQYGVGIKINAPSEFSDYIKWDVSHTDLWNKFIGMKIADIKLSWETVTTTETSTGETDSFTYPQDIEISFSNNQSVFISAAGFIEPDDNTVYGMLDNLTVTDDKHLARQVKMIG